jgi:RHS repeat-associated protein
VSSRPRASWHPASYSYDNTDQLTGDGTNSYGYDANGNRNTGGYTTGAGNQTTSDGTWTYTYDAEGNLVKKSKGASAETWTYGYDERNRMAWAEDHATDGGDPTERVDYAYDALGHRLNRSLSLPGPSNTTTERYGYDGEDVWADLDGSNNLVTRRLFGPGTDQVVARITASGGAAAWYLSDRQGSVTKIVGAIGGVIDTLTYDGFGKVTSESFPNKGDRYAYTGRERDIVTGLQYNRARYYDPAIGRWISMDPVGFDANDSNLYRYAFNDTPSATDPSGLRIMLVRRGVMQPGHRGRMYPGIAIHYQIEVTQWQNMGNGVWKPIGVNVYQYQMSTEPWTGGYWTNGDFLSGPLGYIKPIFFSTNVLPSTNDSTANFLIFLINVASLPSKIPGHVVTGIKPGGDVDAVIETTPEQDIDFTNQLNAVVGNTNGYSMPEGLNCVSWAHIWFAYATDLYVRPRSNAPDRPSRTYTLSAIKTPAQ